MISIKLTTGGKTVWSLSVGIGRDEFIEGFLYGGLFILKQMPSHYFIVESKFPRDETPYRSVDELRNNFDFLFHTYVPLNEAEVQTEDGLLPGYYTFWLRDPDQDGEANCVFVKSPLFLQGLFTALKAAGVPYERVLLHKPIKDGLTYDIEGLRLPKLEDIAKQ